MKPLSSFSYLQLALCSKPVCDRFIYKLIRKHKFRSIVEIGLGDGRRCETMIRVAKKYGVSPNVRYTGVDQFNARDEAQGKLPLIEIHRKLTASNTRTQLVPGNMQSAIAQIANTHVRTDLIIISAGFHEESLAASWFYFPRMLHSGSLVLIQRRLGAEFKCMNRLEIEKEAAEMQTSDKAFAA